MIAIMQLPDRFSDIDLLRSMLQSVAQQRGLKEV
jgi:hypothetical protein